MSHDDLAEQRALRLSAAIRNLKARARDWVTNDSSGNEEWLLRAAFDVARKARQMNQPSRAKR